MFWIKFKLKGAIKKLPKYENCWLVRTDPADVARIESKTFISTPRKDTTIPDVDSGVVGCLGNWMSPAVMDNELNKRFPGCMKGGVVEISCFSGLMEELSFCRKDHVCHSVQHGSDWRIVVEDRHRIDRLSVCCGEYEDYDESGFGGS